MFSFSLSLSLSLPNCAFRSVTRHLSLNLSVPHPTILDRVGPPTSPWFQLFRRRHPLRMFDDVEYVFFLPLPPPPPPSWFFQMFIFFFPPPPPPPPPPPLFFFFFPPPPPPPILTPAYFFFLLQ